MPNSFTADQILALAPDASSSKSGRDLSAPHKWESYGSTERAIWGECRGSGKDPYQTAIDLGDLAFKCTCPSRKFPCKHSLGLFLISTKPPSNAQSTAPDWVISWLSKRDQKAATSQLAASGGTQKQPEQDENTIRRAQQRDENVTAGMIELQQWLRDLVRRGLAELPSTPMSFWNDIAARMVDAQAPGAARLIREMSTIPASGSGWQTRLTSKLGLLHLLAEGYRNREMLPATVVTDITAALGWTTRQDELLQNIGLKDNWLVIGQRVVPEDRLRVRRTWLRGQNSGKDAFLLHFAHGQSPFENPISVGTIYESELVYYPSIVELRAVLKSYTFSDMGSPTAISSRTISESLAQYAGALALSPWLERFPMTLRGVVAVLSESKWYVQDGQFTAIPIDSSYAQGWEILAISGGAPIDLFGEWDGSYLWPLTVTSNGTLITPC